MCCFERAVRTVSFVVGLIRFTGPTSVSLFNASLKGNGWFELLYRSKLDARAFCVDFEAFDFNHCFVALSLLTQILKNLF